MAAPLTVRPFTDADAPALCARIAEHQDFHRALEPHWPAGASIAERYLAYLRAECAAHDGAIFLAVDGAFIAGFICIITDRHGAPDDPARHAFVHDLFVSSDYRRRGIASTLMDAAEAFARARGVSDVRLGVLEHNDEALTFYAARGFRGYVRILRKDAV